MSEKSNNVQVGPGFCGSLFITFLVLKLTHVIDWSWWWVTCPLWGGFALFIIVIAIPLLLLAVVAAVAGIAAIAIAITENRKTNRFIRKGRGSY